MNNLTVVGVEDEHLVLVSADGVRYHVALNEALTNALRPQAKRSPGSHTASPKEIQAHIRRGLTAQQVSDLTGEDLDYVKKFEGAVIAEREFVVSQALAVTVARKDGTEIAFGESIRERLEEVGGEETSWTAWKEESGWRLELAFAEKTVAHQARWAFDPRKQVLKPLNDDAEVLSRHDPMPTTLIPKLSAVETSPGPDRFDSEIFESSDLGETGPLLEPVPYGRQGTGEEGGRMADTADLLEVLRKKRGEREAAPEPEPDYSRNAHPSTGGIRLVEDDEGEDFDGSAETEAPERDENTPPSSKKTRPPMPSWDDIVFGARGDDDPA